MKTHPKKVIVIERPRLTAPMIWRDVGALYLRPLTRMPFVPTDAQRNLMTDDALEEWCACAASRRRLWCVRGVAGAEKLLPTAERSGNSG